ncbi:hypothetical protein AB0I53_25595 [Saccharopolyspora sp. NPDC050389]|uniref:hypothetical protein n=1 Tax=Saccharopolyspora sp. NPDC050389 TaxID=3155516 RepID=UPI00340F607C
MTTYYWNPARLDAPELETARQELETSAGAMGWDEAFLALLRSGQTIPVSIALDTYSNEEATARWGFGNPLERHAEEVLDRARDVLRQPPMPAVDSGAVKDGADHSSALGAMMNLARPEDADLIAAVLRDPASSEVHLTGCTAAGRALWTEEPSPVLIEVLSGIALDASRPTDERNHALRTLGSAETPLVAEIAARIAQTEDAKLRSTAIVVLARAHLDTHRELVERFFGTCPPTDPNYPDIRDYLEEWAEDHPEQT